MAIRVSVVAAGLLKPIGIARDLVLVLLFGVGVQMDGYYAAALALGLAQGVVTGALANHWLPRYLQLSKDSRSAYFAVTLRQNLRLGVAIGFLSMVAAIFAQYVLDLGPVGNAFVAMLGILSLTVPFVFLVAWCANRYLADGRPISAQVALASHNAAFLLVLTAVAIFGRQGAIDWLPLYHWLAVLLSAIFVCGASGITVNTNGAVHARAPNLHGLGWRAYGLSLAETLAFGCLQTALVVLPGNVVAGAGTLGGLVARFYSSVLSLVVSPASQGLLYRALSDFTGSRIRRIVFKVYLSVSLLAILGLTLSACISIYIGLDSNWMVNAVAAFVAAHALQFLVLGLTIIAARILAARGLPYVTSIAMSAGYALACIVLLMVYPAAQPASYVLIASLVLLPIALVLAGISIRMAQPRSPVSPSRR